MKKIFFVLMILLSFPCFSKTREVIAGIEIGSKGVKAVAVEVTDGVIGGAIFRRDLKPDLMSGVSNRLLDEKKIEQASKDVATLFNELKKLDPQYISIVASTAFDNIDNRDQLARAVNAAIQVAPGDGLAFISAEQELYFGLAAAVPRKDLNRSIIIDIGSGNTKIGYATPMSRYGFEGVTLPLGTITLKEKARSSSVQSLLSQDIIPALRASKQDKPGISNPNRAIYIVGGASWALATLSHPEEYQNAYSNLDFEKLRRSAQQLSSGSFSPPSGSEKYNEEVAKIYDVFSEEDLKSGPSLLVAILEEIGGPKRRIVFPRTDSGWIFGYIYDRYNRAKSDE